MNLFQETVLYQNLDRYPRPGEFQFPPQHRAFTVDLGVNGDQHVRYGIKEDRAYMERLLTPYFYEYKPHDSILSLSCRIGNRIASLWKSNFPYLTITNTLILYGMLLGGDKLLRLANGRYPTEQIAMETRNVAWQDLEERIRLNAQQYVIVICRAIDGETTGNGCSNAISVMTETGELERIHTVRVAKAIRDSRRAWVSMSCKPKSTQPNSC